MKYIDINQKFTAKVAEYIAKGYTINTATMSGSQGEVAHVDLTDGKQVVRVLLDSFTEYDSFNSLSGLEITTHEKDGSRYCSYILYKRTSAMNSSEMSHLIDGARQEAQELGIDI